MNEMNTKEQETPQAAEPEAPPAPTTSIEQFQAAIQTARTAVKQVIALLPAPQAVAGLSPQSVRTMANAPIDFLKRTVSAVEETPELGASGKLDVADAKLRLARIDALAPLEVDAAMLVRVIRYCSITDRGYLSMKCREAYSVAKVYVRHGVESLLSTHYRSMRSALRRTGVGKKQPNPGTPATPAPVIELKEAA